MFLTFEHLGHVPLVHMNYNLEGRWSLDSIINGEIILKQVVHETDIIKTNAIEQHQG